ncbi:HAD family hydrolase [Puniceicoccus vermicola]|nr:HAD family hydrolase [Puniceicoccus vermicola]
MILFFDIDETLVDQSRSEKIAATHFWDELKLAKQYTLPAFHREWETSKNRSIQKYLNGEISFPEQRRERIRHFFPGQNENDTTIDSYFEIYREAFEASWSLFPDVCPCLDRFRDSRLGIISNGDSQQQRRKLQNTGIFERFEVIVISGDCGFPKPNKEIFIEACKQMGAKPERCLYIGDHYETDIIGCTSAGMNGILINRPQKKHPESTFAISSLRELNEETLNQAARNTDADQH